MLATSGMNAHPFSSQRSISAEQAPAVDAGNASASAKMPIVGSAPPALPPPPGGEPEAPVRSGGVVTKPVAISAAPPVYPYAAKQAQIQGDVLIDTQIDERGFVTHMRVVSGPVMLRQAALDALRRWKYHPSKLDGKPVAVQMLVTIRFRL
jgi:protein TonB